MSSIIPVARKFDGHTLSFGQQRIYFHYQLDPSNWAYNEPLLLEFNGAVDVNALEAAINDLIVRHESLRTIFVEKDGVPLQSILEEFEISLSVERKSSLEADQEIKAWIQNPFDFQAGPPVRVRLFESSENRYLLVFNFHHIICDGWSFRLLLEELKAAYEARIQGIANPLKPLEVQYVDFSHSQTRIELTEGYHERFEKLISNLQTAEPLALPRRQTRCTDLNFSGTTIHFTISPELWSSLQAFAGAQNKTPFSVIFAAYQLLLWKYTGQTTYVVGVPSASRNIVALEKIFGFFANTVPILCTVNPSSTVTTFIDTVQKQTLEGFSEQDIPFEKVVAALNPDRIVGETPVFQVLFNKHVSLKRHFSMGQAEVFVHKTDLRKAKLDLSFAFEEMEDGSVDCDLQFDDAILEPAMVQRMSVQMLSLINQMQNQPSMKISELTIIANADGLDLQEFEDVQRHTLDEQFMLMAKAFPSRSAVVCDDKRMTYSEVDERSDHIASYLQSQNLGEAIVAIALPRSIDSIVSILGILKAGACYLPLDMDEPENRIEEKLRSSGASLIIADQDLKERFDLPFLNLLSFDGSNLAVPQRPEGDRRKKAAYVLFTSGSTGTPKAVVIEHGNLIHYTEAVSARMQECIGGSLEGLNFATVSTLTADLGNTSVFPSLAKGGTLHVFSYETATDAELFAQKMRTDEIDILKIVPSHFSAVYQSASALPQKLLIFGGETLTSRLVERIYSEKNAPLVCNHYGPTETCVGSLMTALPRETFAKLSEASTMPIGRPLGGTILAVMDPFGNPVPPGAIGELYIGGPGVSRGYLNDEEMTKKQFVQIENFRFYRTGDFVRKSQNQNYYFHSRRDDQFKIRGFRVELAEIDNVLRSLTEVSDVAMLVTQDDGHASIVAFVEPATLDEKKLKEALVSRLPSYMVPQRIIPVPKIVKNKNGKVDRKALKDAIISEVEIALPFVAANHFEAHLQEVWTDLLGSAPASRDVSFFHAGGHSLLAIQLVSRLKSQFGIKLAVKKIFQAPRFFEIAKNLESSQSTTIIARTTLEETSNIVSSSQERLWLLCKFDPTNPFYNEPLAIRFKGELKLEMIEKSLVKLQEQHEQLRSVFSEQHGRLFRTIGPAVPIRLGPVAVEVENLELVARQFLKETFDFEKPLFRVRLLKLSSQDYVLLACVHHIICDGWSMQVLTSDLAKIYNCLVADNEFSSEVRPSYTEYVKASSSEDWSNALEASSLRLQTTETLNLPTDFPRPLLQKHRGHSVKGIISASDVQKLRNLGCLKDATLFHVLLSAFEVLLYRYTNQTNFAVGIPMANRVDTKFENTVGMFVNTVAVASDIVDGSFITVLSKVRETALEALENQGLPFQQVVQKLNPARALSTSPIFQVLFNYSIEGELPLFSGLTSTRLAYDLGVAKYDLSLGLEESRTGEIHFQWEADSALFKEETTSRLAQHFSCLLGSILMNPEMNIDRLNILPEHEEILLINEWNATATDYGPPKTIHEKIEEVCDANVDRVAISFEGKDTTYSELRDLCSRIVTCLHEAGVKKNELVGIMMERSTEMVVSLIGILRAGAAYVPVDPNYPPDRVQYMIKDSNPKILFTQRGLFKMALGLCGKDTKVICVDEELPRLKPSTEVARSAPSDLAYMIYTSGSTGRPKGAMNSHAGIYNRLMWMQQEYQLTDKDVILQKTPFSFDVSVWEFFWPLMFGAKLVIAKPEGHKDPSYLIEEIRCSGVTTIHFVPSMLHAFLANDRAKFCLSLKRVICSGEVLSYDLQSKFFATFAETELHNLYGPTEAAVDVTNWACDRSDKRGIIPIGRPIANIQIYIFDKYLKPVPVGIAGELYIGGVGVGLGYLNNAELTAEKFVPDPFTGKTIYRTGDRARFLADGSIDYLGRLDNQVKLRGFRIELGETEVAISETPDVARSVVMIREMVNQQKELVAYIVPADGANVNTDAIVAALKNRLPDHMVPTAYVVIPAIPVSPSGKVDYKQLPAPSRSIKSGGVKKPASEYEARVAVVWANVLGHSNFGSEESFFDVGGNSLLLLQVQSRLNAEFSRSIELMELFRSPTVAALARSLSHRDYLMSATVVSANNLMAGRSDLANRRRV